MNTNDKEKAKDIAINSVFQSDYPYDERSVRYGAEEMAKHKNEEFKQLLREHANDYIIGEDIGDVGEVICFNVEEFINDHLN